MIALFAIITALAMSPSPSANLVANDSHLSAVVADERAKTHPGCATGTRIGMYAAQAADAFATAAAVRGGGISRTPFGPASSPLTYVASQAAFDVVVGALTRRASCSTKNAIDIVVGGSAAFNSVRDGAK